MPTNILIAFCFQNGSTEALANAVADGAWAVGAAVHLRRAREIVGPEIMANPMAHLGLIIVPLGYADPVLFRAGTPCGASTGSGQQSAPPDTDDLEVCVSGPPRDKAAAALNVAGLSATKT